MKTYRALAGKDACVMVLDQSRLRSAIDAVRNPVSNLAADPGAKATLAMLPKGSQWIGLLSPTGMIQHIRAVLQATMPNAPLQLPEFPKGPPIGAAARATAERLDVDIVVPAAVLEGLGTFVQQMQRRPAR